MRIRSADRFGQDIRNSRHFHHRAHRPPRNNTRTFGSGLEQNLSGTVKANDLMRNGGALQVEANQVLFGLFNGLANRHGDFPRLAHAEAGMAALITDDDQCGETQILAALDHFGDPLDGNHLILQIICADLHRPAHRQRFAKNLFRHD